MKFDLLQKHSSLREMRVRKKTEVKLTKANFSLVACSVCFEVATHADECDLTSKLTFREPIPQ